MKKNAFLLLTMYELARIVFFLIAQTNMSNKNPTLMWYVATPLLGIPFILLYVFYKSSRNQDETTTNKSIREISLHIFAIQKIASSTGLVFFAIQYFKNIQTNIIQDGFYFIKLIPFMMIFFIIDVILCLAIFLKNRDKEEYSEG